MHSTITATSIPSTSGQSRARAIVVRFSHGGRDGQIPALSLGEYRRFCVCPGDGELAVSDRIAVESPYYFDRCQAVDDFPLNCWRRAGVRGVIRALLLRSRRESSWKIQRRFWKSLSSRGCRSDQTIRALSGRWWTGCFRRTFDGLAGVAPTGRDSLVTLARRWQASQLAILTTEHAEPLRALREKGLSNHGDLPDWNIAASSSRRRKLRTSAR